MNHITSTFQGYQPIFVGAGCLAMGYMFGRHCRSIIENGIDVPMASNAACCVQSESNYFSNNFVMDQQTIELMKSTSFSIPLTPEFAKNLKKFNKQDLGQVKIFDHKNLQKTPKKKEDALWAQTGAFKKQKGVPIIWNESKEIKSRCDQDSDDEILAQRLEYFARSASGTRASINKPRKSNFSKFNKKRKTIVNVMTSCTKARERKEIILDSQKTLSKETTRSFSGFNALAACLCDQGECSLEDTCRSPKTMYLGYVGEIDEGSHYIIHTNFAQQNGNVKVPCVKSSTFSTPECNLSISLKEHIIDDISLDKGPSFINSMDNLQCKSNECDNNSNHNVKDNKKEERLDAKLKDIASEDGILILQSRKEKLDLPTSHH